MTGVDMSQISPPIRILLVASLVLLAAWFAFLRPKTDATTAPAPVATPAVTATGTALSGAGKAVDAAKGAAAAAATADAAGAGEASSPTSAPSATATASATATPAATPAVDAKLKAAKLPSPVTKALAADKVLVLLLWNPKASDDRAVRAQLRKVDRHHGKVAVQVANVARVARYGAISEGVDVQQSPSIVVVDRNRKGTLLTGYVDAPTIDQAISDALRTPKS